MSDTSRISWTRPISELKIHNVCCQRIELVTGIPSSEDFYESGRGLLDLSWDMVAGLMTDHDEATNYSMDLDEYSDEYWQSAKRHLTTALSIMQQGVELTLKGKIAELSPFLLLADPPQKWPSPYRHEELEYSAFRTIEAQDLIRVHDTFIEMQLPDEFVGRYHGLRLKRNTLMHTVNKNLAVHAAEIIDALLYMHSILLPGENWASIRVAYLRTMPSAVFSGEDFAINQVCWELSLVFDLLKPAQVLQHFNINKRQRRYLCPKCNNESSGDWEFIYKLAVLDPNEPSSTTLFCPVCNAKHRILRKPCSNSSCKSNVLSSENLCLKCGRYIENPTDKTV